jgi:hypothetical protein
MTYSDIISATFLFVGSSRSYFSPVMRNHRALITATSMCDFKYRYLF